MTSLPTLSNNPMGDTGAAKDNGANIIVQSKDKNCQDILSPATEDSSCDIKSNDLDSQSNNNTAPVPTSVASQRELLPHYPKGPPSDEFPPKGHHIVSEEDEVHGKPFDANLLQQPGDDAGNERCKSSEEHPPGLQKKIFTLQNAFKQMKERPLKKKMKEDIYSPSSTTLKNVKSLPRPPQSLALQGATQPRHISPINDYVIIYDTSNKFLAKNLINKIKDLNQRFMLNIRGSLYHDFDALGQVDFDKIHDTIKRSVEFFVIIPDIKKHSPLYTFFRDFTLYKSLCDDKKCNFIPVYIKPPDEYNLCIEKYKFLHNCFIPDYCKSDYYLIQLFEHHLHIIRRQTLKDQYDV